MFQNRIKELCQKICDSLRKQRIKEGFLEDVEFQYESFVKKALKCLSQFITSDYYSKTQALIAQTSSNLR